MASLDGNLKRCCTSSSSLSPSRVDRLTSLPFELLTRILSMLPTKDVAVTQVLSKRMRRAFCSITIVDLDESPISHCVRHPPHLVERFPLFESFVDNVLLKLSQSQVGLTRFRLRLGGDHTVLIRLYYSGHKCEHACFPNPEPTRLYAWISYPLAHSGLKDLDLTFHVRNPAECKLPPGIFSLQSLQLLRLDSNLEINVGADFPVICLPNLKLLHLHSFVFTEDTFVTRLVSDCPALEDLSITHCWWVKADRLILSSNSLKRLALIILKHEEDKNGDLVLIDTPNLQYFDYSDSLPFKYSITHLNALVQASIDVVYPLQWDILETSFRVQLSLASALSNVQHLSLHGCSVEMFHLAGVLKDPLPVFRNLRTLNLTAIFDGFCSGRWDIVLLILLHCSPFLEALIFPEGFFSHEYGCASADLEVAALEAEGWRTTQTIPSCCQTHLKRIMINKSCGCDQELNMMKFLLGNASVLKEFFICLPNTPPYGVRFDAPNFVQFKNTLEEIPRASNSCSIIYSDDESAFK